MRVKLALQLVFPSWVSLDFATVGSFDIVIMNFRFGSENLKTQRIHSIFFLVVNQFEIFQKERILLCFQPHFETPLPIS